MECGLTQDNSNAVSAGEVFGGWRWTRWLETQADRHRNWVFVGIFVLYLLSFNGLWRIGSDSGLYLSVAQNIAGGQGYSYHGEAHRLAYPGLPYLLAGLMRISPKHYIALADGAMLGMGLLSLTLCYHLFRHVVRRPAAVIATAMVAGNFLFYKHAFELLTDIPFILGTLMVLLGGTLSGLLSCPNLDGQATSIAKLGRRAGWFFLPAGLALCALMRPTVYPLIACLVLSMAAGAIRKPKARLAYMIGAAVVVGLMVISQLADPRREEKNSPDIYEQAITIQLKAVFGNPSVALNHARQLISPELPTAFFGLSFSVWGDWLASAAILGSAVWVLRRWPMAMLWIAATLGMQLIVEPVPRYMMPILPLLILAWWETAVGLTDRLSQHRGNTIAILMTGVMLVNAGRCIGEVSREQYQRPFVEHYRGGQYAAVMEMAEIIRQQTPERCVIIAPSKTQRILTCLTGRWAITAQEEQIPVRFRDLPVFVVVTGNEAGQAEDLTGYGIRAGELRAATQSRFRKSGPLKLLEAGWQ